MAPKAGFAPATPCLTGKHSDWAELLGRKILNRITRKDYPMNCLWCGKPIERDSKFGPRPKYCSSNCKVGAAVKRHRQSIKARAIAYKGGKCQICGYDKCVRSLTFHHTDPSTKSFSLTQSDIGKRPWSDVQAELDKCMLVCANCHGEIHDGLVVGEGLEPSAARLSSESTTIVLSHYI